MTGRTFETLFDGIRRRLADYLELDGEGADTKAARELSDRLDAVRARLGAAFAAQRRLGRSGVFDDALISANADKAISAGRDDLARALIRNREAISARTAEIERELAALEQSVADLASAAGNTLTDKGEALTRHASRIRQLLSEIERLDAK